MNRKTLAAIGILLTAVTLGFASAQKAVDRPPGIAADQWFPISNLLGLVISDYQPGLDLLIDSGPITPRPPPTDSIPSRSSAPRTEPPAPLVPALSGYLMIKQKGHWTRLSVVSPPITPPGMERAAP